MKILLVTLGSKGDLHPFLCIGLALKKRGHDVTLISSETFADIITTAGLNFISCSPASAYSDVINNPDYYDARKSFKIVLIDYFSLNNLIYTKTDKNSKAELTRNIKNIEKELLKS